MKAKVHSYHLIPHMLMEHGTRQVLRLFFDKHSLYEFAELTIIKHVGQVDSDSFRRWMFQHW
jgi:hypothetical protein